MMPIIKFIPTNAFITSFVVSKLQVFCIAYMFVFVTMISRSLFIPVTVWNMPKGVEPWSRSTNISASKLHSFFVIGFSLSSHFHSSVLFFFLCFVFVLRNTTFFLVFVVLFGWSLELFLFRFVFDHRAFLLFVGIFG